MNPTKTTTIKNFLTAMTQPDLAELYNGGMECQVNVAQDGGEHIGGDFKGRKWHGWTDGSQVWKMFRIPWNPGGKASYEDTEMKFDLSAHAEGIGMTGWDWKNKKSRWVAYDFDAIVGHSDKRDGNLTPEQMRTVEENASKIPWITVRRSTSGRGLHLYVFLDPAPDSQNHHEHAAIARALLGQMSAEVGFDFESKLDVCGGNMWVWHRKMKGTDGLTVVKQGTPLGSVPINWRDHLEVVKNKTKRLTPGFLGEKAPDEFEQMCGMHTFVALDDQHKAVIDHFKSQEALWWWDQDRHMLVCHTADLKSAHKDLALRGIFETDAQGTETQDQNAFAFPMPNGSWVIRRHTKGVSEHASWDQDGQGWTRCFFNREPDLKTASKTHGGIENEKGGFDFLQAESAALAAAALGVALDVPVTHRQRKAELKAHKDGRVIFKIKYEKADTPIKGWNSDTKHWYTITGAKASTQEEIDVGNFDDVCRHLVTDISDCGWVIHAQGKWVEEPLGHVKLTMKKRGFGAGETDIIMGGQILNCWTLVSRPFQPEYTGDRTWNRDAAQLAFQPDTDSENHTFPIWQKVLDHCGAGLDEAVLENGWCKANGVVTGADYLKCWVASLFQEPTEPLPYLFMFGPQDSGKSIFHEALALLVTKGYQRADLALTAQSGFNGELEKAVICVVEETDLHASKTASNRIKDWVTSRQLNIRHMYKTPYHAVNTTHWIQCNNDDKACPIFPGDTRITMIYVGPIEPLDLIPKKQLLMLLAKEAPQFLGEIMQLELPPSNDRLNVPVVTSVHKQNIEYNTENYLDQFIREQCFAVTGASIRFSKFFSRFQEWFPDPGELGSWSKIRVSKELSATILRGRLAADTNQVHIGNLSFDESEEPKTRLTLIGGNLRPIK